MNKTTSMKRTSKLTALCSLNLWAGVTAFSLAATGALAKDSERGHGNNGHQRETFYQQTNLVSDQAGVALLQDTNLVNAWGISFAATSPFWVSDNGTGLSTLYSVTNDATGYHVTKIGLQVAIPGEGNVTGQLANNTTAFNGDAFIFASEDGTISGWRGALGTTAEVLATRSHAVYKGITLSSNASGPILLAANFAEGTIDVYGSTGSNATLIAQFADSKARTGYAPFNVQSLGGVVFVSFAKHNPGEIDDVGGIGHGLIDILNPNTGRFKRFATGSDAGGHIREFNSPWGLAIAPATFGKHGDKLLVGNFGSGTIMTFEADGDFRGLLEDPRDKPIVIDGLWALTFGNGSRAGSANTLFFTAGPDEESHGLFGALDAVPRDHRHHDGDHDGDDD